MSTKLVNRLNELAASDKNLEILVSQWSFDEKLIAKALANIGSIFSHYSRHDESHSKQILINIERVLGAKISLLSASDIWLLLESAYCHDIGMVIPKDHIRRDWLTEEFQSFLNSGAAEKAKKIISRIDLEKPFRNNLSPIDFLEELNFVLADYYRAKHAARSESIVRNPLEEIGLNSPRTELLPKRLFNLVGKICLSHGQSFEEVMALSHSEVGVGNDNVHPRLIACLLRLGDLLDLDDNRFCPVMLRCAGVLPEATVAHIEKHSSIQVFQVDSEFISVEAQCSEYAGFTEITRWLEYLKEELSNQKMRWHEIIPSSSFGSLPTIKKCEVGLNNFELLNGKVPKFSLNNKKIFNFLTGEGIYKNKNYAIRELLQNSVDACLIKIWLRNKSSEFLGEPSVEAMSFINRNSNISIDIKRKAINKGKTQWSLKISDDGVGIDLESMSALQNIGTSRDGSRLFREVQYMPVWMRPSGSFGIGFQSVFMLTSSVKIKTKSLFSFGGYQLELKDPRITGDILISQDDNIVDEGTSLEFDVEFDSVPSSYAAVASDRFMVHALKNHDPIRGVGLDADIASILNVVEEFSKYSLVDIKVNYDDYCFTIRSGISEQHLYNSKTGEVQLIEVKASDNLELDSYLYKWQPVQSFMGFEFLSLTANILSGDASELLKLSRDGFKGEKGVYVKEMVRSTVIEYFNVKRETICSQLQPYADAFFYINNMAPVFGGQHLDIKLEGKCTLKDFVVSDSVAFHVDYSFGFAKGVEIKRELNTLHLYVQSGSLNSWFFKLLNKTLRDYGFHSVELLEYESKSKINQFTIKKNEGSVIPLSRLKLLLKEKDFWSGVQLARKLVLCPTEYAALSLDIETVDGHFDVLGYGYSYTPEAMVLPFTFFNEKAMPDESDELIDFIYTHRKRKDVSRSEIKHQNKRFIEYIISEVMFDHDRWAY